MLFWILLSAGIWIAGMFIYYILDGWFDYGFKEGDTGFAVFTGITWPVWVWFVIPCVLAGKAHDALKEKKQRHDQNKERLLKIRIAEEKEIEKIQAEIDAGLDPEEELQKLQARRG